MSLLSPTPQQLSIGKHWAALVGGLTFLAVLLPAFLNPLWPSVGQVLWAMASGTGMGTLAFVFGLVWASPVQPKAPKPPQSKAPNPLPATPTTPAETQAPLTAADNPAPSPP
jgi:hypothetical protein